MIKLIVGLGNPGQQYERNRHNAGFLFLDYFLDQHSGAWGNESKFYGVIASTRVDGSKVILLKPQTFMNRSGQSVGSLVRFYKLKIEEILVVHDELDLTLGVVKLKKGGGHAGHNGLRDIIANLGGNDFYRLRLGIGRPQNGRLVTDYVLSDYAKQEETEVFSVFNFLDAQIGRIVVGDMDQAMNTINKSIAK